MATGIVTIYDLADYGNRLQNYATSHILSNLGIQAMTLITKQRSKSFAARDQETALLERLYSEDSAKVTSAVLEDPALARELRFREFTRQHIPSRLLETSHLHAALNDEYDFFLACGENLWNPTQRAALGHIDNYLLSFVPPRKRICFAAGIGLYDFPDRWKPLFRSEFEHFTRLSTCDSSTASFITNLCGKRPEILLDPIMMLSREDWDAVAKPLPEFDYREGRYILYCFNGDEEREISPKMREALQHEAATRDLVEYHIADPNQPLLYAAGPAELIDVIKNAALICTDSFYAAALSIIYEKPFLVCDAANATAATGSFALARTDSLLRLLHMEEKCSTNQLLDAESIQKSIDFSRIQTTLCAEQDKARDYLCKCFGITDPKTICP